MHGGGICLINDSDPFKLSYDVTEIARTNKSLGIHVKRVLRSAESPLAKLAKLVNIGGAAPPLDRIFSRRRRLLAGYRITDPCV